MTTKPIHFTTPEEAVKVIKSGDHVHLSSVASAPQCLINAMCKRGEVNRLILGGLNWGKVIIESVTQDWRNSGPGGVHTIGLTLALKEYH